MRLKSNKSLLLALALVLSQWLTFAHHFSHPALASAAHACEFCVHAQGVDGGGTPTPTALPLPALLHEAPAQVLSAQIAALPPRYYPIRGPPLSPA